MKPFEAGCEVYYLYQNRKDTPLEKAQEGKGYRCVKGEATATWLLIRTYSTDKMNGKFFLST